MDLKGIRFNEAPLKIHAFTWIILVVVVLAVVAPIESAPFPVLGDNVDFRSNNAIDIKQGE